MKQFKAFSCGFEMEKKKKKEKVDGFPFSNEVVRKDEKSFLCSFRIPFHVEADLNFSGFGDFH